MYEIKTGKIVDNFLEKHLDIAKKFILSLEIIKKSPFENNLDIKPLKGMKNHFRLRIGKYRFLYEINQNQILIYFYDADTRGDVYK